MQPLQLEKSSTTHLFQSIFSTLDLWSYWEVYPKHIIDIVTAWHSSVSPSISCSCHSSIAYFPLFAPHFLTLLSCFYFSFSIIFVHLNLIFPSVSLTSLKLSSSSFVPTTFWYARICFCFYYPSMSKSIPSPWKLLLISEGSNTTFRTMDSIQRHHCDASSRSIAYIQPFAKLLYSDIFFQYIDFNLQGISNYIWRPGNNE